MTSVLCKYLHIVVYLTVLYLRKTHMLFVPLTLKTYRYRTATALAHRSMFLILSSLHEGCSCRICATILGFRFSESTSNIALFFLKIFSDPYNTSYLPHTCCNALQAFVQKVKVIN